MFEHVVNIVKLTGKRGLSYRGTQSVAAYTLEDNNIDHGNFLELAILLGKYDVCMKEHLTECVEKNKKIPQTQNKGQRSLLTFLSKTTVNKVISTVQQLIQETIAKEITEAGMYSAQIDTIQDITSHEQCSIVRQKHSPEKAVVPFAMVKCEASYGQYFVQMLTDVMENQQRHQ